MRSIIGGEGGSGASEILKDQDRKVNVGGGEVGRKIGGGLLAQCIKICVACCAWYLFNLPACREGGIHYQESWALKKSKKNAGALRVQDLRQPAGVL